MTVLSGQSIRQLCNPEVRFHRFSNPDDRKSPIESYMAHNPDVMITPYVERTIQGGRSYGLSHAGYDIRIDKIKHDRFDVRENDSDWKFRIMPGDFVLASSIERIKMPNNLIAFVHDKSSWAREGLALQNTVLEPGWEGYITLELSFHRPAYHALIKRGDPIAQIVFHRLDEVAEQSYKGKYQNQEAIPVEARLEAVHSISTVRTLELDDAESSALRDLREGDPLGR